MENPKYFVNIVYVPNQWAGQKLEQVSGVTTSVAIYSGDYFKADMPELNLTATGSTYQTALTNLLSKATASNVYGNGHPPVNNTHFL